MSFEICFARNLKAFYFNPTFFLFYGKIKIQTLKNYDFVFFIDKNARIPNAAEKRLEALNAQGIFCSNSSSILNACGAARGVVCKKNAFGNDDRKSGQMPSIETIFINSWLEDKQRKSFSEKRIFGAILR